MQEGQRFDLGLGDYLGGNGGELLNPQAESEI
jgi:hypothetical protein